ncbi:hypothetical protein HY249_01495 [Candidatus Azambacteria bacterium]|nr:hypothetical protein [Candidatus Azambacteria bacterium]
MGSDPRYPLFLGNMVGAYVIEKAMKNAPKISISKMTRMPVKKIIGLSKVDL